MDVRDKKVFVGLSGGVDSAVSALLLKRAGARVTGVFIQGWYPPGMHCSWAEDRRDAMRVAAHLRIPFATLDASAEYKKYVIDYLLAEYRAGRTPNPDVMCNREVKFGAFYRYAKTRGADLIATGHYRGGEKDQSYFLWAVEKLILADTVFPVGQMDKRHVRSLAKKTGLAVAGKKDSQGVCFLGDISMEDFLKREFAPVPGTALDERGVRIGSHDGAILYTIGERLLGGYVVKKDIAANTVNITANRAIAVADTNRIPFHDANWLSEPAGVVTAQSRYRGPLVEGRVEGDTFIPNSVLSESIASGQSIVFYRSGELAGGGIMS